jgi:hypothetical protein
MSDRTWMKIHSGLNDPEHRRRMGARLWLFMHFIDKADWDTGMVWFFRDADAAEELDMPLASVRRWRHELRDAGYIRSYAGEQCQHIMIMRWRNPRLVNPPQINVPGELSEMITPPKNDHPSLQKSDHPFNSDSQKTHTRKRDLVYEAVFTGLTGLEYIPGQSKTNPLANKIAGELRKAEADPAHVKAYYDSIRAMGFTPTKDWMKVVEGVRGIREDGNGHRRADTPILAGMPASKRTDYT